MNLKYEQGTALVYTMIFMTLMIMAGLASVQFSSLEQRTSSNFRTRQATFFAAETILLEAEHCIRENTACSDVSLFDNNCTNGLCFNGSDRTSTVSCRSGNQRPWELAAIWTDNTRHITATSVSGALAGRYIIEFLCYVPRNPTGVTPSPANPRDWSRIYRITALSVMANDGARVMLQSTYKW